MKSLITGATGFVGSAVLRQMLARGIAARVLARPGGDQRNIEGLDCEIAEGDLNDSKSIFEAGSNFLSEMTAEFTGTKT